MPPPPPGACFGRDELIKNVVGLAENLKSIALIGAGGIGKTSIALTILHNDRIKRRFGESRWFIRCDQFPASRAHFLHQLSKTIGAGVKNPEDLVPLRPFLSSRDMIIFLDNAESVLDPQGTGAQEIYTLVEELGRFSNICVCVTSRISIIPPHFEHPVIPTLTAEAACNIFYAIYHTSNRSTVIDDLLRHLDFHALSITLLATVALRNMWDYDRVAREWDTHRTQVLQTDHNESLATTIELSLTSSMFGKLGPDARDLLSVIAFFPQGIDQNNLSWLFPTVPNAGNISDKFCVLSLTYRSNGFIMMLAPLRDYLCPKNPLSSPLFCKVKEQYFHKLSVEVDPNHPGFKGAEWIMSEDVNVEHLLDILTSANTTSDDVWDTCARFIRHLYWHKPRLILLGPKFEGLPDGHPSKPKCLLWLSRLVGHVGNRIEEKRLLVCTLGLWREQGSDQLVARTLKSLAEVNWLLDLHEEGIQQAKESLEIFKQLHYPPDQADSLRILAQLLCSDNQLDAAEEAASQSINLLPGGGGRFEVCHGYRTLGNICHLKGKTEEAISHYKKALGIASPLNWHDQLFTIHYALAGLFSNRKNFNDTQTHLKQAKLHATHNTYQLGQVIQLQARVWYEQSRLEEAQSEALCAIDIYEKVGAVRDAECCRNFLQNIERKMKKLAPSDKSDPIGEFS